MSIKTVTFAKNGHGVDEIEINTEDNTIWRGCEAFPFISMRHYRLIKRGTRIEFMQIRSYIEIQADIKSIK